jgi:hypothetical protein
MEEIVVDSHIQMPKCMLKRFENEHHSFFYYDVEKSYFGHSGHARSLNTKKGFFSFDAEQFLNDNYEKPFAELLKTVDAITIDPPGGNIDSVFDYRAKRFVNALIARNPAFIERIRKCSGLSKMLSDQQLNDLGVVIGLAAEEESGLLEEYGTTIAVNLSSTPLVLPICGAYIVALNGFEHIFLPVSPQRAIVFIEAKGKGSIISNGIVHPYALEDEIIIDELNRAAFSTQCKYGNGYVVSPQKTPLIKAKSEIDRKSDSALGT